MNGDLFNAKSYYGSNIYKINTQITFELKSDR